MDKFVQAEDDIRDFCLSRGLGNVYKRQLLSSLNRHAFYYLTIIRCTLFKDSDPIFMKYTPEEI